MDDRLEPVFVVGILVGIVLVLFVVQPPPSSKSLPEKPTNMTNETTGEFVSEYEHAYKHNQVLHQNSGIRILRVQTEVVNRTYRTSSNGFIVDVNGTVSFRQGRFRIQGDRYRYEASYFVNETHLFRADSSQTRKPYPDPFNGSSPADANLLAETGGSQ